MHLSSIDANPPPFLVNQFNENPSTSNRNNEDKAAEKKSKEKKFKEMEAKEKVEEKQRWDNGEICSKKD